jgi:hypothetical protein
MLMAIHIECYSECMVEGLKSTVRTPFSALTSATRVTGLMCFAGVYTFYYWLFVSN